MRHARIAPNAGRAVANAAALMLLAAAFNPAVQAGHDSGAEEAPASEPQADKAVVVPYKTRPAPTHRVSLRDDRVYFLKKLERTENGFILHTLEDEIIEVERSNVAEIVEFKKE